MNGHYCSPHRNGVAIDAPPFFFAGCITCEKKKAAGKIPEGTGPLADDWWKSTKSSKRPGRRSGR